MTHNIFEISRDAKALAARIAEMKIGEVLTYIEISKLLTVNAQSTDGRSRVRTARYLALEDHQIVLQCVKNVGYERISESDKALAHQIFRKSIRRRSKKVEKVMAAVDIAELTNEQKIAYSTDLSHLGFMSAVIKEKNVEKIVVANVTSDLGDLKLLVAQLALKG